ncbi:SWIM zinc finger family protein [Bacillus sp. AK031]
MNLSNFKKTVNKKILARGRDYYMEGNIAEAISKSGNEYHFIIEGTHNYEVEVKLDEDGEIIDSQCDCPYDYGPICKHEAAAYFQLYEILNEDSGNGKVVKKIEENPTIQGVLSNLSKDELIQIIIDITNTDGIIENSLMMKYSHSDSEQELESCQKLIDGIVRKYTGRNSFIPYRETSRFMSELETVLEKARETADPNLAVDISLLLLEEAVYSFQYADDSGGDIGGLVSVTLDTIEGIALKANEDGGSEEVFMKLLAFAGSEVFDGWENFRIDLLRICLVFSEDEMLREQLSSKLQSLLEKEPGENYMKENLLQLQYELIDQYGSKEEALQFIESHLDFSSFRERLLDKYLQEQNYQKVLEAAIEGEVTDQKYPGLVSRWKKYRYTAYKSLSLKKEQELLAKELLMNGDFHYYQDLKELAEENSGEFYTNLKQEIINNRGWYTDRILLQLIEEENDVEALLEFVRENPGYIEKYAERLEDNFQDEVIEIYRNYLFKEAKTSSNRSSYREIGRKINRYKQIAGKLKQQKVIDELKELYKKKPAFLDELGKIAKD